MPLILDCTLDYSHETSVRLKHRSQQDDFVVLGMTKGKVSAEIWRRALRRRSIPLAQHNAAFFTGILEAAYELPAHRTNPSPEKEILAWLEQSIRVYVHPFRKSAFEGAEVRLYWAESDGEWIWKDSIKSVKVSYER